MPYGSGGSTRFVNGGLRSGYFDGGEQSSNNRRSSYHSFKASSVRTRSPSIAASLARSMGFERVKKQPVRSRFNPENLDVQPKLISSCSSQRSSVSVDIHLSSESETIVYLDQIEFEKYAKSPVLTDSDVDSVKSSERNVKNILQRDLFFSHQNPVRFNNRNLL